MPRVSSSVTKRSSCGRGRSRPAINAPANAPPRTVEPITVDAGTIALDVGHHHVEVPAGDSAWFDATLPHTYSNPATGTATFTLLVFEPA